MTDEAIRHDITRILAALGHKADRDTVADLREDVRGRAKITDMQELARTTSEQFMTAAERDRALADDLRAVSNQLQAIAAKLAPPSVAEAQPRGGITFNDPKILWPLLLAAGAGGSKALEFAGVFG